MSTPNYRFYITPITFVPYSFTCEHCGKDSGKLKYAVSGLQNGVMDVYSLDSSTRQARSYARRQGVNDMHRLVSRMDRGHCPFDPYCPHCHEFQSWGAWQKIPAAAGLALKIDLFVVLLACILWNYTTWESLCILSSAIIACLVILGTFVLAAWLKARRTPKKSLPRVYWEEVEYTTATRQRY